MRIVLLSTSLWLAPPFSKELQKNMKKKISTNTFTHHMLKSASQKKMYVNKNIIYCE